MEKRTLELVWMLRGLRVRIKRVRAELMIDYDPIVTSRLWKAEMLISQAENHVHRDVGRNHRSK